MRNSLKEQREEYDAKKQKQLRNSSTERMPYLFKGEDQSVVSSGLDILRVIDLPAIPTKKIQIVHWLGPFDGGNGDNQLWAAAPGYPYWCPLMTWTLKTGVVV